MAKMGQEIEPEEIIYERLKRRPPPEDIENRLRKKRVYTQRADCMEPEIQCSDPESQLSRPSSSKPLNPSNLEQFLEELAGQGDNDIQMSERNDETSCFHIQPIRVEYRDTLKREDGVAIDTFVEPPEIVKDTFIDPSSQPHFGPTPELSKEQPKTQSTETGGDGSQPQKKVQIQWEKSARNPKQTTQIKI